MLKIEKVSAGYGKFNSLYEISMEVPDRTTVIAIGSNGAGKTTLLKVIAGLLKPTSGKISFDGQRIDDHPPHEIVKGGISFVPEGGRVFPELTVEENLQAGAYPRNARKFFQEKLREVFQLFPILEKRKNQLAGSMSGGERQMLAIARALMSKPKLIMLDEPSSGLAPLIVSHVFEHIAGIKSQGYSILMMEQNIVMGLEVADFGYLLELGKVQYQGPKEQFKQNPHIKSSYLGI